MADTPSVGTCPREGGCNGWVRGWEWGAISNPYGRTQFLGDLIPCPEHNRESYARAWWGAGAAHKGRRRWWKR